MHVVALYVYVWCVYVFWVGGMWCVCMVVCMCVCVFTHDCMHACLSCQCFRNVFPPHSLWTHSNTAETFMYTPSQEVFFFCFFCYVCCLKWNTLFPVLQAKKARSTVRHCHMTVSDLTSYFGSRQTLTSLSTVCLMRRAHARMLSNTAHCPVVTSKPVCCMTVPDSGSGLRLYTFPVVKLLWKFCRYCNACVLWEVYFVLLLLYFFQLYCPNGISPMGNLGCFPQGKPAATELCYPTYCACWVLYCFHNPSNSDMDYRVSNVYIDVNAYDCTWGLWTHVRESALKVDWEQNPIPHWGIEPASTAWQSNALTNWATSPPTFLTKGQLRVMEWLQVSQWYTHWSLFPTVWVRGLIQLSTALWQSFVFWSDMETGLTQVV